MGLIPAVGNTAKTFRKRIKNDKKTLGLCMVVVGESGGGGVRVGGRGVERVLRELSGSRRRGIQRAVERAFKKLRKGLS